MENQIDSTIVHNWYQALIKLLEGFSRKIKQVGHDLSNEEFASFGTTVESQRLIQELCDEIDEEYIYRNELEEGVNIEAWFDDKVKETLDSLAQSKIIDQPTTEDYQKTEDAISDAVDEGLLQIAECVATELNVGSDTIENSEIDEFLGKEDE